MSLFQRIKEKANEKGISISELERELGFGRSSIRKWDTNTPSLDKVIATANFLQTSISWLATGDNEEVQDNNYNLLEKYKRLSDIDKKKVISFIEIASLNTPTKEVENNNIISIPNNLTKEKPKTYKYTYKKEISNKRIYNYDYYKPSDEPLGDETTPMLGWVAAGTPNLFYYDSPEYINSPVKSDFAMCADGDSMEPVIKYHDYIFIKSTPFLENGEIGIISIDGETVCKTLLKDIKGITLKSFNKDYDDMRFTNKECKNLDIKILGKVILTPQQEKRYTKYNSI